MIFIIKNLTIKGKNKYMNKKLYNHNLKLYKIAKKSWWWFEIDY